VKKLFPTTEDDLRKCMRIGISRGAWKHPRFYTITVYATLETNCRRRKIPNVVQKIGDVEVPPLILGEWQFAYAFAAVDGSHLPIKCPNGGAQSMKQYFNFKGFYSVVLMALVDAEYRFIWASVGAPGTPTILHYYSLRNFGDKL